MILYSQDSRGCNPCYNGSNIQYSQLSDVQSIVVILVIMEVTYSRIKKELNAMAL